jgi:hypothetical protein
VEKSIEEVQQLLKLDLNLVSQVQEQFVESSQIVDSVAIPYTRQINESIQSLEEQRTTEASLLNLSREALFADNAPWEMFLNQLREKISGGSAFQGVQLLPVPQDATFTNLGDPTKTGNYVAWRVLGDTISQWNPTYVPTPQQVTTGYKLFLTNLALPLPDPEDVRKSKQARDDYEEALDDLDIALEDYQFRWEDFNKRQQTLPSDRQVSFDVWYQRTWARRIASREDGVRLAFQAYSYWVRKASGGYEALADAIEAFNNDGFQSETITPSQAKVKLRRFEITPSLDTFINNSRSLPAGAPPAWSFTLNKSSFRYSFEETKWRGGAIYLGGFIGYAGASGGRTSIDTSSDSFSLEFSARNIQVFTITPGEWFAGSIVSAFKNGPWIPEGPVATGRVKLWGTEGILRLLSTQVVVVYQPKIKVSVDRKLPQKRGRVRVRT